MSAYRCAVVDWPWAFKDALPGNGRGAVKHYGCMAAKGFALFPWPPIADDAWLFLWRVGSQQQEALDMVRGLGFTAQSEIVWIKTRKRNAPGEPGLPKMGMGRSVRNCHEVAIVAKRGRPERKSLSVRSVIYAPPTQHSAKPDLFYGEVERFCDGPRVDIFARKRRPGWDAIGDELDEVSA